MKVMDVCLSFIDYGGVYRHGKTSGASFYKCILVVPFICV